MVRSVPEKTFEHWASMYVANSFPRGSLWWPAFDEDIRVEELGVVPGKSILLEVKVPEAQDGGRHAITIDLPQLYRYLGSILPVFYAFPVPQWRGELSKSSWLGSERRGDLAYRRAGRRWFGEWTYVCSAISLYRHLKPNPGAKTAAFRGPLPNGWVWPDFWRQLRMCGSVALRSLFIIDSPITAPSRDRLREYLRALRLANMTYGDVATADRGQQYVYVPERAASTSDDTYRLVNLAELADNLGVITAATSASADGPHLAVCSLPFTALNLGSASKER